MSMTLQQAELFNNALWPRENVRALFELSAEGAWTVLAWHTHYKDTLHDIHREAAACFRRWPDTRCVLSIGGEFDGYHMPASLWVERDPLGVQAAAAIGVRAVGPLF